MIYYPQISNIYPNDQPMSDAIKHECGIALMRLRKPLEFYIKKYGSPLYAVKKLSILMQKQRNRGQDGAGVANIKIDLPPGIRYISRYRSLAEQPVDDVLGRIAKKFTKVQKTNPEKFHDATWLQHHAAFSGELWLGHLRYGTHGTNTIGDCHPHLRQNNWRTRSLVLAGNFNMTNVEELFNHLIKLGQHPKEKTDTVTIMEKIGHFLDEENNRLFDFYKTSHTNQEISPIIEQKLDLTRILQKSCRNFDGGYVMAGLVGHGAAFVVRDPMGIRPAYYYANDEVIVATSERPPIKAAFNADYSQIKAIKPGHALIIQQNGDYTEEKILIPKKNASCSFERIYFSRSTDPAIYQERKIMGALLVPQILQAIHEDLADTVFTYIPNTAAVPFLGLIEGLGKYLTGSTKTFTPSVRSKNAEKLCPQLIRTEMLITKDTQLRTFIADDCNRYDLVTHVYDTTPEVITPGKNTLVVIDDSIVRGTTLEKGILTMLDRLKPKKIIIVACAPQVRYPDCYGIDMSKMYEFVAFRAAVALLKKQGKENLLNETYRNCLQGAKKKKVPNYVKAIYAPFSHDVLAAKIGEMITSKNLQAKIQVIYQTIDNLHKACPKHLGDWYFTGNYPTPGGNSIVNKAFVNFMEGKVVRAY